MSSEIIKETEAMVNPPVMPPAAKLPGIFVGAVIGILLCSTAVLAFMVFQGRQQTPPVAPTLPTPTQSRGITPIPTLAYSSPTPTPTPVRTKKEYGPVNWLQFPKILGKIDIFMQSSISEGWAPETAKFHQIGSLADGSKLINLYVDLEAMGSRTYLIRLVETPSKKVEIINWTGEPFDSRKVNFVSAEIEGIEAPDNLETSKGKLVSDQSVFGDTAMSFTELKNPVFYEKSNYGDIFVVYNEVSGGKQLGSVKDKLFYLRLKDDTVNDYQMKPAFIGDDNIPKIIWDDSTINKEQFVSGIARGCGSRSGRILNAAMVAGKVQVGTADGQPIYQIKDINNPLNVELFNSAYFENDKKMTAQELISARNHFLWQDGMGDWILFVNTKFEFPAECGKPVIYLYPEKETQVSVKVGANISQSEPLYPQNGWQVLAKPSGELIYQGQSYPYLFWEGLGFGCYPDYKDNGTVVAQKNLVNTVYSHLHQLGLNNKESSDFMEFWREKLPKTPYVRLTWLMTEDMDKLAPLKVSPKPESYIRIFLEFEGLEKPIKLIPQKLTSKARSGFTLIEWGGLLTKEN